MTEHNQAEINHTIKGKPLPECSYDELAHEMNNGLVWEAMDGLTKAQQERLTAVERELDKRPLPPEGGE